MDHNPYAAPPIEAEPVQCVSWLQVVLQVWICSQWLFIGLVMGALYRDHVLGAFTYVLDRLPF